MDTKILAIGAATQDVFLTGKALTARRDVRSHAYVEQFPLGAKLELDQVAFDTGGGATNAAVTFARQGLRSGFVGKIGHDPAGAEVLRVLHREGVATDHVAYDTKHSTGFSTLLLTPKGERTVLVYRGASDELRAGDFSIETLQADWFYITSLGGNLDLLGRLVKYAHKRGIKVALDPGQGELAQVKKLRGLLTHVEVLKANRQEMRQIFGGDEIKDIIGRAFGICPYIVLTDGAGGTYATDSDKIYHAGQYQKVKVVDRTGAGDAFGSGFVTALAKGWPLEDALTLASANATAVVQKVGAKAGILKTGRLRRMKIRTVSL
ncbi:carbohydrate kinase family protein [Candidatus Parcubacteria bacterium]|nr:carbohydrate kinase family protein [Candidatus Parcubacteria bacterium]